MKHKKSFKALWNVFIFVICGGSLIYGFVHQRKSVEYRLELEKYKLQADSLKKELKKFEQTLQTDAIR